MTDAVITRRSRCGRVVAAAALALVAVAAPLAAQTVTEVSISPSPPTWRDLVEVNVAGTMPGNCIPIVGPPNVVSIGAASYRIDLLVAAACPPLSTGAIPFRTHAALPALYPGSYSLRVFDAGGATVAQQTFQVYEVADAVLELPPVSTADHPGSLRLTWLAGAGTPAATVVVDGHVVEVRVSSPPAFPPTQLATLDVPLPPLAEGAYELRVLLPRFSPEFPGLVRGGELHVLRAAGCVPDATTLCLHDGRFRITATWRDFVGRTGAAHAAPLVDNDGSGLLWFFGADNAELTVKVLDACTISQRWWTFVSSSSTVEYTLTVTDTVTGATRTYSNPLGQLPRLVADTGAFACP
ncbi:MAG TPA: hypothetical protein VGS57_17315 [Thermoanaerobaculia bacterium]|jgi:hypothetical protein|nr:hypothetical protein [Thermoanaerobaculia bacterium]